MNSKFFLRLISVLGSSLLVTVQLAPLAKAQGNISDATGANNFVGNLSDATGLLAQLLDGTLTEIGGIAVTPELIAFISTLNGGNFNIQAFQAQLEASGVPPNLALDCANSLGGLFVNGQVNLAQLTLAATTYLQILSNPNVTISNLFGLQLFGPMTGLLGILTNTSPIAITGSQNIQIIAQTLSALPVGGVIGGITITTQIQQLIVLSIGSPQGLTSALIGAGVPPALANDCVGSLTVLFTGGSLSAGQLNLAAQFYLDILATPGVDAGFLGGLFASVPGLLTAFSSQSSVTFTLSQTIQTIAAFPIGSVVGGVPITPQFQLLIGQSIGGQGGLIQGLIAAGVPPQLANDCVGSLGGLFTGGALTAAQLDLAAQFYIDILNTAGVNASLLGGGLFGSVPGLLTALSAQSSVTFASAQTIQALAAVPLGGTIGGIAVSLEVQQLILGLSSGNPNTLINLQAALTDAGVPLGLAQDCVGSLAGLFANGGFNVAGLGPAAQFYLEILFTSGVNISSLSAGLFGTVPGILSALAAQNSQILTAFPLGQVVQGVTITENIQLLILASSSGNLSTLTSLQSVLSQSGLSASVVSAFVASLNGLFVNGQVVVNGLDTASQSFQGILNTSGVNISLLNGSALFQSIQQLLTVLNLNQYGNLNAIQMTNQIQPAGNNSDGTGPAIALNTQETAQEEVTEEVTEEVAQEVTEEVAQEVVEEVAQEVTEEVAQEVAQEATQEATQEVAQTLTESETAQATAAEQQAVTSEAAAEVAATSQTQSTSTTAVEQSQTATTNVTTNTNVNNNGAIANTNNAAAVTAGNAVVTTSAIAGGFAFASYSIVVAVIQVAQSLVSSFGSSVASFAGISISIRVQVTVVSVMTSSSVSFGSVPTYVSSLNGGGALVAAAPVDTYVNNLIDDGVPANYAEALATTMEGIIIVDSNGEVTGVDPTKLTTAIAVYNQTINQLSAEALSEPSETLLCTGLALSSLSDAAADAANQ